MGRSPIGVVYWVCLASSCILSSYHSFGFREKWTGGVIGGLVRISERLPSIVDIFENWDFSADIPQLNIEDMVRNVKGLIAHGVSLWSEDRRYAVQQTSSREVGFEG